MVGKTEAGTTPGFGYATSGAEGACIRLPNTPINIRYHSKPGIEGLVIDTSARQQTVNVWWSAPVPGYKIVLEYVFGPDLVLRALRSSDSTIRMLTEQKQKGQMTSREIDEFLPPLRAGVEYWNGSSWEKTPHLLAVQSP